MADSWHIRLFPWLGHSLLQRESALADTQWKYTLPPRRPSSLVEFTLEMGEFPLQPCDDLVLAGELPALVIAEQAELAVLGGEVGLDIACSPRRRLIEGDAHPMRTEQTPAAHLTNPTDVRFRVRGCSP